MSEQKRSPVSFRLSSETRTLLCSVAEELSRNGPPQYTMTDVMELAIRDYAKKILGKGKNRIDMSTTE
jgi:hypothetical protein